MHDNLKRVLGIILLIMFGLAVILVIFQRHSTGDLQQQLTETRRQLREQGFKIDLTNFDLTTDPGLRARAATLTYWSGVSTSGAAPQTGNIDLLPMAPDGSGIQFV